MLASRGPKATTSAPTMLGPLLLGLALLACTLAGCGDSSERSGSDLVPARSETVDGVSVDHFFTDVGGVSWHWVEAGRRGRPSIVFVHGLPESWYSWHHQIADLATDHHVVAIDLKGFGESGKPATGYSVEQVSAELAQLLTTIGVDRFHLVSHDWGTAIAQELAAAHPDRIRSYVRMQAPVAIIDLEHNHRQFFVFQDQPLAVRILSAAETLVHAIYGYDGKPGNLTVQALPNAEIDRIVAEFARPGTGAAVARLFVENPVTDGEAFVAGAARFARMTFPVLLLQGALDPNQPRSYFVGATDRFPDARLEYVDDAGHFTELEQPAAVTAAIRRFLDERSGSRG